MTIDWWTLGFQAVNVLILIWLLQRFFWRPVAAMIEQRRTAARKVTEDAEAARVKATEALSDIDKTRAGFAKEREAILAAAHEDAERAHAARLAEAATAAASLEAAASAAIAAEHAAAEKAWSERSSDLAVDLAARLAARLDGAAVRLVFLDWLLQAIRALPEATRQAADGMTLAATSATPLELDEQAHASTLIGDAFGGHPAIDFKVDPTLIAGLELTGPHLVVGNSWRADLAKARTDLAHDQHS